MTIFIVFLLIFLSIASAFLYRVGGLSKEDAKKAFPWLPSVFVNTLTRDLGCPAIALLGLVSVGIQASWWVHLIAFVLMFLSLRTYWDRVFGHDNFFAHGFAVGLAYLPYVLTGSVEWFPFAIRCASLAVFMGVWCLVFSNDFVEEYGRGGIIPATLILFK